MEIIATGKEESFIMTTNSAIFLCNEVKSLLHWNSTGPVPTDTRKYKNLFYCCLGEVWL